MAECLGVDLGADAVTVAVASGLKAGLAVTAFERTEYAEGIGGGRARAEFAAGMIKRLGFERLPVAISLSGGDILLKPLSVPFTKRSHIAKTLEFELEELLLLDVESAVIDFCVTGSGEKGSRLLVAALSQAALAEVTAPFEEAGLRVEFITADVLSAAAVSRLTGRKDFALLSVSPGSWKLSLVNDGALVFARAAPAAPSTEAMETALGGWYRQSIMAASGAAAPEMVYMAGPGSRALDCERLSEIVGARVEPVTLPEAAAAEGVAADVAAGGLAAVTAAVQGLLGASEFDFYVASRGSRNILDFARAPLTVGLVAIAVLFSLIAWGYRKDAVSAREGRAKAVEAENAVWREGFPEREAPPEGVHAALQAELDRLQRDSSDDATGGPPAQILKALYVLSKSVPEGQKPTFTSFTAKKGEVAVKTSAADAALPEALANAISTEGTFEAESRNVRTKDDRWTFEIVMTPARSRDAE